MAVIYKLVGFDRETEALAAAYDIPPRSVVRAKEIAGIADKPEIYADWPLNTDQAAAIADIIGERVDLNQEFALEPYYS